MSRLARWKSAGHTPYLGAALAVALAAFVVRVCTISANLPDVPNPDEFKTIWPPLRMAYGNWQASSGYPPLYMFILLVEYGFFYAAGTLAGTYAGTLDFARQMIADPTPLYVMGRVSSVVLGTATVLVLLALGRRLYDARVGLLAALLLAFDTTHVYASQVVKNDALMMFVFLLSFWFTYGILERGRTRDYALAGLFLGLATAAKYNALAGALAIVAAHLLRSHAQHVSLWETIRPGPLWLAGVTTLGGFLLGYPHFLLDPATAWQGLRTNSVGFFWAWLGWEGTPLGWFYYPAIALNTAWGLPVQLLAGAGLAAALMRRRPVDLLLAVMPLVNYMMMGGVRVNQPRYFFLGMPFLLLLAARLAIDAWRSLEPRVPVRARRLASAAALAVLLAWPAGVTLFQDYMLMQPDPRVTARDWMEENVPAGSRIVLDMGGPALSATPESLLASQGPPRGRFEELSYELASARNPSYWILPIVHYVNGEAYIEAREASVQPWEWYRAEGYDYVVTSTLASMPYTRWAGVAERYPRTMAFYESVGREAHLVAEFAPVVEDPRAFDRTDLNPLPTIRIYNLNRK